MGDFGMLLIGRWSGLFNEMFLYNVNFGAMAMLLTTANSAIRPLGH